MIDRNQIEEKMRAVEFFFQEMVYCQQEYLKRLPRELRPPPPDAIRFASAFQYNFAALLSAHRSARYYIIRLTKKIPGTTQWRDDLAKRPMLEAFHHLRDTDIHDHTLSYSTRYTIADVKTGNQTESTTDLYLKLHNPGFAFDFEEILNLPRLRGRRDLALLLTSSQTLVVTRQAIDELKAAIDDGRTRGFIP